MGKPDYRIERVLMRDGLAFVAGVDEVGRGPLAGPVAVAAVILDPSNLPRGVDDSKALTAGERERLAAIILEKALSVSIAFASVAEVDALNIRVATLAAMVRAVGGLSLAPAFALIDGIDRPGGLRCAARAIVGGDASCLSIAAASIVAKVARDRLMIRLDARHPGYGFARHVGYGTPFHLEAIARLGPTPFHRLSFAPLRKALAVTPGYPGSGGVASMIEP
ncbi:MAG: ribonuclease HII [Roseiarcus sp.]